MKDKVYDPEEKIYKNISPEEIEEFAAHIAQLEAARPEEFVGEAKED